MITCAMLFRNDLRNNIKIYLLGSGRVRVGGLGDAL